VCWPGSANASEALAKSSGCLTCHAVDTKKMGPAFKETAKKYKGNAAAEGKLVEALSKAQGHPEVKAKGDDVKTLVSGVTPARTAHPGPRREFAWRRRRAFSLPSPSPRLRIARTAAIATGG
jgi:cytochrome c551/c552